jgi:hypothetical protein
MEVRGSALKSLTVPSLKLTNTLSAAEVGRPMGCMAAESPVLVMTGVLPTLRLAPAGVPAGVAVKFTMVRGDGRRTRTVPVPLASVREQVDQVVTREGLQLVGAPTCRMD